jgi:hypothetical protein
MGWVAGPFVLLPGQSVRLEFDWNGQYAGTQFALARPANRPLGLFFDVPGVWEVRTTDHGLRVQPRSAEARYPDFWVYGVTVSNASTSATFFELTGGEVAP